MALQSENIRSSVGGEKNPHGIIVLEFETGFKQKHPRFQKNLSKHCNKLTRKELLICSMVHEEMKEKEIADLLGLSVFTIENYRTKIRKKLGLTRTDVNLYSFLLQFS